MARITVLGGTGYAGSNIAKVAAERGHTVVAYSRNLPKDPVEGVDYLTADLTDPAALGTAAADTDVLISAISPRGDLEEPGALRSLVTKIADVATAQGVRLGVVGGAGSLLVTENGPRLSTTEGFPEAFKQEADEMAGVLEDLRASDLALDWFSVSPAAGFGGYAPGEATGTFRIGGDVLLSDDEGTSFISGADFALAIVREIEEPTHRRARFTVAY